MKKKYTKKDELMDTPFSDASIAFLASCTCQWWNSVFLQYKRFSERLENDDADLCKNDPWRSNACFLPERHFLIMSIHHAIESLQKLDIELKRHSNIKLDSVYQTVMAILDGKMFQYLRNMNEHYLEYEARIGNNQSEFRKLLPQWTCIDKEGIKFGRMKLNDLILVMRKQYPEVQRITKEVYYEYAAKA